MTREEKAELREAFLDALGWYIDARIAELSTNPEWRSGHNVRYWYKELDNALSNLLDDHNG